MLLYKWEKSNISSFSNSCIIVLSCMISFLGKIYKSVEEESQRKNTWLENRKLVLIHNILADQGIKSYRLGMNFFADMVI